VLIMHGMKLGVQQNQVLGSGVPGF
jgi:hypothetical protein